MKRNAHKIVIVIGLLIALSACGKAQPPKIIIVRHAEKLADWPGGATGVYQPLSETGIATANRLADAFEPGSLTAIFSSATTRTLHTAFPVSQKLGIPLEVAEACADTNAINAFYEMLQDKYGPEDTILLVSHSNIVPYLLIRAGLPKDCYDSMDFTESQDWLLTDYYGELFVIDKQPSNGSECAAYQRSPF